MNHCSNAALSLSFVILPLLFLSLQASAAGTVGRLLEETAIVSPQAEKFVRGQLTLVVSTPGPLRWDVGNGSDYLPLQVVIESLSGSDRVSVTVVDQALAPLKAERLPPRVLPRYYRILSGRGIKAMNARITVSYADADLNAAGIGDENRIRVFQQVDGKWVERTVEVRNPKENTITVVGIDRFSDIILSGASGPVFKPVPQHIGFGPIKAGMEQWRTVTITNVGIDSLKVLNVFSTNDAFRIGSTEEASDGWHIPVAFHPTDDGVVEGMLIVEHNGESSPDTLTLSGIGMAPIFNVSKGRIDFARTLVGLQTTDTVRVSNYGSDTLVVTGAADLPACSITPLAAVIPPLGSVHFAVTFRPKQRGEYHGRLLFTHNAREKTNEVDLYGIGAAPIFVPPRANVDLGSVYLNESVTRTFVVRNEGNAPLIISGTNLTGGTFRIEPRSVSILEGDAASFRITYTAGNSAGNRTGVIVFYHNAPSRADTLRVDVSVVAKAEGTDNNTPGSFFLLGNYPNPFNPVTTIQFGVPTEAHVTLRIFTMLGVQVRTLASGVYQPGSYSLTWDATNDRGLEVATGMYFYRFEAQPTKEGEKPFIQVRKMLFVK
jgi:hypothetical protein